MEAKENSQVYMMLIEQYKLVYEEKMRLARTYWQLLSLSITVTGITLGIAFSYLSGIPRALLLFITNLYLFALLVSLGKIRFFEVVRSEFIKKLEQELGLMPLPRKTSSAINFLREVGGKPGVPSFFLRRSASRWTFISILTLLLCSSCLLLLTVIELLQGLTW